MRPPGTMSFFAACIAILLGVCTAKAAQRQTVVVGADLGTESARVGIFNTRGEQLSTATASYTTTFPKAGWAEQSPDDWWTCLSGACKKALSQLDFDIDIAGLCVDTTCCSVVALDKDFRPLRPCLLWMDSRSFQETDEILKKGQGDEALKINCNGEGPLSAEWMIPKSLWIKKNEPDIWKKAKYVCESQDYMNYRMTGRYCASTCNCGPRWHWNAEKACLHTVANPMPKSTNYISELAAQAPSDSFVAGRPVSLLRKVGMEDILDKWPQECVGMGQVVGKLTPAAAKDLGLPAGIPVAQGGADAYVGIVGLGCTYPGQMVLITGSSHLHLVISAGKEVNVTGPAGNELSKTDGVHAAGVWGSYQGTPLLGLQFAEGGQSSTGSILNWAKRLFNSRNTLKESSSDDEISYKDLDAEASKIPIGCDGLLAIETFQGQRTPVTDAQAKGALLGLTLAHTRAHIWRALLEAVCLGTRAAVDALTAAGLGANEIVLSGGPTRSPLWLQMHADAAGLPVVVGENDNGPLLGCAVLAAVGAGLFDESDGQDDPPPTNKNDAEVREAEFQVLCQLQCKVRRALRAMVRRLKTVYPQPDAVKQYDKLYKMYSNAVSNVRGVSHMLTDGIDAVIDAETPCGQGPTSMPLCEPTSMPSNGLPSKPAEATTPWTYTMPSGREAVVAPSMLSADFGNLAEEARMCERAGAQWVHLDVCDNSDGCRGSLTFGPKIINAIHLAAPTLALEVHAMAADLESLVAPLAAAGTSRLIFQLESTLGESKASRSVSPAHTTSVSKRPHDGKNKHGPYYDGTTGQLARAIDLAVSIRQHGMRCGVCITPSTPVEVLEPLLSLRYDPTMQRAIAPEEQSCTEEQNTELLIELVDILAVNPGFGGQNFDPKALQKVTYLRHKFPTLPYIAVDGGINEKTCELALKAGANVLTAGSFVFLQHESSTHSVTMNDVNVRHVKVQTRNVSDGIEPLMKGLNILRNAVKIHGI